MTAAALAGGPSRFQRFLLPGFAMKGVIIGVVCLRGTPTPPTEALVHDV